MPLGRVLIVDDDRGVAAMLRDAVVGSGYTAAIALNGAQALGLMSTLQPDVVLLDVTMPGLSGADVLERLRREYPLVPVIMVTGNQDEDAARQLLRRGAFDYLPKPFQLDVLERIVGAAVASRPG